MTNLTDLIRIDIPKNSISFKFDVKDPEFLELFMNMYINEYERNTCVPVVYKDCVTREALQLIESTYNKVYDKYEKDGKI